jgi:hypothetical protein
LTRILTRESASRVANIIEFSPPPTGSGIVKELWVPFALEDRSLAVIPVDQDVCTVVVPGGVRFVLDSQAVVDA